MIDSEVLVELLTVLQLAGCESCRCVWGGAAECGFSTSTQRMGEKLFKWCVGGSSEKDSRHVRATGQAQYELALIV